MSKEAKEAKTYKESSEVVCEYCGNSEQNNPYSMVSATYNCERPPRIGDWTILCLKCNKRTWYTLAVEESME